AANRIKIGGKHLCVAEKGLTVRQAGRVLAHRAHGGKEVGERCAKTTHAARRNRKDRREVLRVALYDLRCLAGRPSTHHLGKDELVKGALYRRDINAGADAVRERV